MRRLLQSIIHNRKLYDRPQDEWTCGRAAEGCPCVFGPDSKGQCRATTQCLPAKKGDRWVCTRAISLGGPCERGPQPDGACGCPVPPCTPVQSLRAKRQRLTWLIASLAGGVVLLALWGWTRTAWSSPGPLTAQHAMSAQRCADCHVESGLVAFSADARAQRAHEHNLLCLKCHDLGTNSQSPHGAEAAQLLDLARRMRTDVPPPLVQRAAQALAHGQNELACAACHQEHHGRDANLQRMSDQQCQVCHQAPFANFTSGHPEFTNYPSTRRTRLQFDHVTHWQKYFPDPRVAAIATAPTSCAHCHEPAADGRKMLVRGFEQTCAQCHAGQIEGEGRAGAKGLVFLRLPEVDVAVLEAAGEPVGEWPDYCEGEITPFMRWMLEGDPTARQALAELGPVKLADLARATPAQKKAAAQLVWSVKGLLADLVTQGQQVMMRRLDPYAGSQGATRHTGNFSPDSLQAAQQVWLPGLLAEVAAYRHGDKPALRSARVRAPAEKTGPAPAPVAAASDDLLADPAPAAPADNQDLLTAEPPAAPAAATPPVSAAPLTIEYDDAEARVVEGGWYRRDATYALYYRPSGHADEFLTAWLETSANDTLPAAQAIYTELASPRAPGTCMKCHTADRTGKTTHINWLTGRPQPHQHPFTTFRHAPHFSLMGVQGCVTCHVFDAKSDYAGSFGANRDSTVFHSNFAPIAKDSCVACHQPTKAGASCQQCHNYHTGELSRLQLKTAEFPGATSREAPAPRR